MRIEEISDHFFAAIENGDSVTLNQIYADDVTVWHNFSGYAQAKAEGIATLVRFAEVAQSKYDVIERHIAGDKVAQRRTIEITPHDGSDKRTITVAMFLTFKDGQITYIYEYLDSADVVEAAIGTPVEAI